MPLPALLPSPQWRWRSGGRSSGGEGSGIPNLMQERLRYRTSAGLTRNFRPVEYFAYWAMLPGSSISARVISSV